MGKILITGGAGFIGSQVNLLLNEVGYETVIFDNLKRSDKRTVVAGELFQGDLLDKQALKQVFSLYPIDAVLHFAGLIDVGESWKWPFMYYENNTVGSLNLFEEMQAAGVKHLIFSSTAALYGYPQSSLIREDHSIAPINPYGRTKWMVEEMLKDLHLNYIALRYFNAAGGDPHGMIKNYKTRESNLIPLVLKAAKGEQDLTIYGDDYETPDGTCIRDYIHVADLAQAHLLALQKLLSDQESTVYNLGNGAGFSVKQVIETAEKVLKQRIPYQIGPRRVGDPPVLVADSTKAHIELKWKPRYSNLDKIIADAHGCCS